MSNSPSFPFEPRFVLAHVSIASRSRHSFENVFTLSIALIYLDAEFLINDGKRAPPACGAPWFEGMKPLAPSN